MLLQVPLSSDESFYKTFPTTTFWLLHAAFAFGCGFCFVAFKFIAGHHLQAEPT